MKKLPISKFDLGIIIAFVVIGLLGGGAWYYLSNNLVAAQQQVSEEKAKFDQFSSYQISPSSPKILVTHANQKILQGNIDMLKSQLTPLIQDKLMSKENKLYSIDKLDPVTWKHNLDDKVRELTAAAAVHSVKLVPPNFYFTFAAYLNQNPNEDQTEVLSKQMLAVEQLSNILINAPVRSIINIERTYEEDSRGGGGGPSAPGTTGPPGRLNGSSYLSEGGAFRVYPFAFEFETSTTGLRKVMNDLIQSPYIFVVRTVTVQNLQSTSPHPADLDKIVGSGSGNVSMTDSGPGVVAATTSTKGPQYLFGNSTLHVRIRVDLVEWLAPAPAPEKLDTTGAN